MELTKTEKHMNSVDKLFKNKLADEQLPPSPQAWEKLEARLSKKNKTIVWLRVAAAVALVCLLSLALVNLRTTEAPVLTETQPAVKHTEPKVAVQAEQPLLAESIAENQKPAETKPQSKSVSRIKKAVVETPAVEMQEAVEKPETTAANTEVLLAEAKEAEEETAALVAQKPIVIVYTLPSIQPKETATLPTATLVAQADGQQRGIQKLWEAAKEVKNSDNPLGDLREAKNELFALDFKKTKNRN